MAEAVEKCDDKQGLGRGNFWKGKLVFSVERIFSTYINYVLRERTPSERGRVGRVQSVCVCVCIYTRLSFIYARLFLFQFPELSLAIGRRWKGSFSDNENTFLKPYHSLPVPRPLPTSSFLPVRVGRRRATVITPLCFNAIPSYCYYYTPRDTRNKYGKGSGRGKGWRRDRKGWRKRTRRVWERVQMKGVGGRRGVESPFRRLQKRSFSTLDEWWGSGVMTLLANEMLYHRRAAPDARRRTCFFFHFRARGTRARLHLPQSFCNSFQNQSAHTFYTQNSSRLTCNNGRGMFTSILFTRFSHKSQSNYIYIYTSYIIYNRCLHLLTEWRTWCTYICIS